MIKLMKFALIAFFLLPLAGCNDSGSSNNSLTGLSSLNGSFYTFETDRISILPDVQYPSDNLDESDFEPAGEGAQYNVIFSEDGQTVIIEPGPFDTSGPISGAMIANEKDTRSYEINEGLTASGRFVIWMVNNEFEAELTAYGSGVPIIQSERGVLYENDLIDLSSLNGNLFDLEIDRISELPDVQYPNDDLDESDYEPTDEVVQYNVSFSEDGKSVTIETDPISGKKVTNENDKKYYEINQGLFAGGRFILWIVNDGIEAELTIYGAGVPIIQSKRGYLYQNGNKQVELSALSGNTFTLELDRISVLPDIQSSSDDIDESSYEPADRIMQYNVSFSEDGQIVTIETDPINGQEIAIEDESRSYEIVEGSIAGGRFVVWIVNNKFEAELTTYGSGVPIIQSERGALF